MLTGEQVMTLYRVRWQVETLFRNSKQLAGLAMCQCRVPQAMVRHVTLVFVTCFVLDLLRTDPSQTTDGIRHQLQLEVVTQGFAPPTPLRARTM
ncbi:MAG TPA: transposase, partial [Anaerolineae bacterium]|nr:transposase [Anaerolineae bacterium]